MMLDAKRTFDELIERLAPDDADARRDPRQPDLPAALRRRRRLAGVHGGGQALRARPLRRASTSIVLDTPPSRNALDFLDAPDRLTQLLRGPRAARVPGPDGAGGEGRGPRRRASSSPSSSALTGVDLLQDLSVFFRALGGAARRLPRARGGRQGAAGRPRHDVPRRHLARARAGRGGDLLPRQAARGAACRSAA